MDARTSNAYRSPAFPGNPLPFLTAIADHVREHGTASIQSDDVKRAALVLVQQIYGQCAVVDTCSEYARLSAMDKENDG